MFWVFGPPPNALVTAREPGVEAVEKLSRGSGLALLREI